MLTSAVPVAWPGYRRNRRSTLPPFRFGLPAHRCRRSRRSIFGAPRLSRAGPDVARSRNRQLERLDLDRIDAQIARSSDDPSKLAPLTWSSEIPPEPAIARRAKIEGAVTCTLAVPRPRLPLQPSALVRRE
jgi:hypothetical protein